MLIQKRLPFIALLVILLSITLAGPDADAALRRGHYPGPAVDNELVFEGGLMEPLGDQQDDFFTTLTGFGATTGYDLGLRYRMYLGQNWALSPTFHYGRFGSFGGVANFPEGDNLGFDIRLSHYRYGLDLQTFIGSSNVAVRPFLTGGIALVHNMYRDELQYVGIFNGSVNSPAYSAGVGLKARHIEISAIYNWNRFDTTAFSFDPVQTSYNWDYAVVRVGFAFGRY